jgi:hypothetical protein
MYIKLPELLATALRVLDSGDGKLHLEAGDKFVS